MATNQPLPSNAPVDELHLYNTVATEIEIIFNYLIEKLIARRDAFLSKLQTVKEDFVTRETTRKAAIEDLERKIRQAKEDGSKENANLDLQEQIIQLYRDRIELHHLPTKLRQPFFSYPTLYRLQTQISEFGEMREWKLDYSLKKKHLGNLWIYSLRPNSAGLALDEPNQLMYIADWGNGRIQVQSFASRDVERFGQGILKRPWGIAVTEDNVFVTDESLHALFQFSKKDSNLLRTGTLGEGDGQLNHPRGLCIDYNTDVYVADCDNHRVSVFSKDLIFLNCLNTQQLKNPRDVKVTPNCIVVLDESVNCIHFFSRSGVLLRSCVTRGEDGMVYDPWFFCLDPVGNILISDCYRHNIKVFSQSGQLIRTGRELYGRWEFLMPYGICMSLNGKISVAFRNR